MKRIITAAAAALALALCLASCSGKTGGATTAAPETTAKSNIPSVPAETYTGSAAVAPVEESAKSDSSIDFVYEDYYFYSNTVARITEVSLEQQPLGGILGLADVEITALDKSDKDMKIGYTAYDKDGNIVRELFLLVNLTDPTVKQGSVVEDRRFDLPDGTAKVVFHNYTEN